MARKTTYSCDWCGKTYADVGIFPLVNIEPHMELNRNHRNPIQLFPEVMRQQKTETAPAHFETEICHECATAIIDAVRNCREIRISKRPR